MINSENLNEIKLLIKKERKPIIILAKSNDFNRKVLEQCKFDILLSPESGDKKDTLRQIDSGFNEILANIAKKKGITIGIDLGSLRNLEKEEKSIRLAKIKQNLELCKKFGVKTKVLNSKDKRNAFSLLISLGASTKQAKEAIS